ncbi:SGNH hydrolase-type esterase domain-containing protein [Truncatella angustata]|uniref:SGNH hydrolase-type esterase domain-containing protein n=1 Tax=Truncatella angustata TaxID=152316 RepID=A0A9P8RQ32_9PEZI|nr:SGNH hydrolase-type esterase domain-containing protein [Truncatella angustata]KAH6647290.1 SGNH hydrolase-type esterase domain-containing protein [Truncatella angustata]
MRSGSFVLAIASACLAAQASPWLASFSPAPSSQRLRPLTGFVALGDSYSAGIGTGVDGAENDCRQGAHAYPAIIAKEFAASQGGPNATFFQFLSCTGATTHELLAGNAESQMDALNGSLPVDFALLSVGGNDLGFFEVMNACIFRFYNFYSGTCESALQHAQERLNGDEFEESLFIVILQLLDKVRWEKKPWFLITVTGYARFFNEQTEECNDMSLGVWWRGPKLKKELRVRMNAMVQAVNEKIENTVAKINSQFVKTKVLFVNYDTNFEGHRFCEPGVQEPDYQRDDTYFFLVGGPDNARNETQAKQATQSATVPPHSELVDPHTCLEPAQRSGDWGKLALCYMAISKAKDPTLRFASGDITAENSMWYVPTYYGKTFHPRTLGHEKMRSKVYETWHDLGL